MVDNDGVFHQGFVPLQAADWLAYELNLATQKFEDGNLQSENELRWPMREFLKGPPGYLGTYLPENLKELQNKITQWAIAAGLPYKK
jgi:hypothetical protein